MKMIVVAECVTPAGVSEEPDQWHVLYFTDEMTPTSGPNRQTGRHRCGGVS
jgi:hypothetical protein